MSLVIKKLLIDAVLCIVLFLISIFVAGLVMARWPGCMLCAAKAGMVFWLSAAAALQPVLWLGKGPLWMGALVWVAAFVAGSCSAALMEWLVLQLQWFGLWGAASEVDGTIKLICVAVPALVGSALMARRRDAVESASPMP